MRNGRKNETNLAEQMEALMARLAVLEARDARTVDVLTPAEVAAPPRPSTFPASVTGAVPDAVPLLVRADAERVTTTSLVVAERFGKRHDNVLREIERLFAECEDEEYLLNFEEASYEVQQPNGGITSYPMYRLTRDAFVLLAMGFTGKEALRWKIQFIKAFNQMEQALRRPSAEAVCNRHDSEALALLELTRGRVQKSVKGTAYNTVSLNTAKVLGWLWNHCQTDRRWYPFSRKAIARQVKTDHTVVLRAMRRLIEWDLIEEQHGQDGLEVRLHRRRLEAEMETARRRAFALSGPAVVVTG